MIEKTISIQPLEQWNHLPGSYIGIHFDNCKNKVYNENDSPDNLENQKDIVSNFQVNTLSIL